MSQGNPYQEVGQRIAQARGQLTQAEFAAQLGVDRKTVVRWEGGERLPDGESLTQLWLKFQANANWVLTGMGTAPPLTAREAALLDNYRHASEVGRRALEQTGAALAQPAPESKAV